MSKIMLVNVTHVEESRVAILEDGVLALERASVIVGPGHPYPPLAFVPLSTAIRMPDDVDVPIPIGSDGA